MKVTMLGTGNALVTECYNTCYVLEENGEYVLVDAGGGNQVLKQLKNVGISFLDIHHIYVTHKHVDHIMGVIWMVRMIGQFMSKGDYEGEAWIYGHEEVIRLVEEISCMLVEKKSTKHLHNRIHLVVIEDGQEMEWMGHPVRFFDIHSPKAKQFGYQLEYAPGKVLTCLGDENYNDTEADYVKGSTWLMHEAFCLASQADIFKPYEKGHSAVKDACQMAQEMGVENLILYHTEDANIKERKKLYYAEGKPFFTGRLEIPDDLECIEL